MKKNIAMRVAAFLFILTMISTCAFATTFAKYTTSKSATDEARVAKWGVTLAVTGDDAFSKAYKDTVVAEDDASLTVKGDKNVVAPGTKGTLLTLAITGEPEVDTKVTIDFSMTLNGWVVDSKDYCPLVFKVNDTEVKMTGEIDTLVELQNALEAAVEGATRVDGKGVYDYNANANIARTITVTWEWAFNDTDVTGAYQQNAKDTALGNLATAPKITFSINCTVEQVD